MTGNQTVKYAWWVKDAPEVAISTDVLTQLHQTMLYFFGIGQRFNLTQGKMCDLVHGSGDDPLDFVCYEGEWRIEGELERSDTGYIFERNLAVSLGPLNTSVEQGALL